VIPKWIVLFLYASCLFGLDRASSYPYLSGDTWRFFADWRLSVNEEFEPTDVRLGDTIFVEYDLLKKFGRKYLPKIKNRFILITPNCESGTDNPQPGRFAQFLESNKLAAWFVQNIDREPSERVIPIPIGLANQVWPHGQLSLLDPMVAAAPPRGANERDCFVYVNFSLTTNIAARKPCLDYFRTLPSPTFGEDRSFKEYLEDLARSVFVASPPGNGLDCHRTWEALLMGCYPIVVSSTLNPLYEGLPVLIVSHWKEVTEDLLQQKQEEFRDQSWNYEKLYAPYWYGKIFVIQKRLRDNPTFMEKVHAWFRKP
jgi:hypothetical protein